MEDGREGARGGWGREWGIDDVREGGSGSGGRDGGLRKGTSEEGTELGMDGARERREGGSERRREGATEQGKGTGRSVGGRG